MSRTEKPQQTKPGPGVDVRCEGTENIQIGCSSYDIYIDSCTAVGYQALLPTARHGRTERRHPRSTDRLSG